ncbi:carboxymethylenebutenolidase homolog isoform X2 [Tripterygium wilfordii]|uniref:carboxymethylenebutenolidase homolog isoform X2 n=1 Tax=Tripterygium wilfordii TaxID=458696 RepID=UPI0018F832B7|nr:carboxymethylenebutenolidase homolog isoform X2 [Tripterygium wilfordii]
MGVAAASPPTLTPVFSAPRGGSSRPFPRRRLHFLTRSASHMTIFVQKEWNRRSFTKSSMYRISSSLLEVKDGTDDEACELVNGVEISIGDGATADSINAHLFTAVKNNNGTGILLLSDVFGFEDSATRDFAYRVACNGYNVLVPDLFRGDPWNKDQTKTTFEEWKARQDPHRVAKDIEASTKWMVDEFIAAGISKKLGIIGFCYGGARLIEVLARDGGVCFGVGVSFYGARMDPSLASSIQVPVLLVSGDDDSFCPVDVLKDIEKRIGRGSKAVIYNGRGHGFAHRPGSPEEDRDAEEAFMIMRNWLYDGLIANI